jgi:hypothetical protein
MLDFKTQSQLVDATATIMRSYLRAATNTLAASASRSMSLWTEMLDAASPHPASAAQPGQAAQPLVASAWPWLPGNAAGMSWTPLAQTWWLGPSVTFWAPLADWRAWGRTPFAPFPAWCGWPAPMAPSTARAPSKGAPQGAADDGGFSSYRSSGGHASAQVIMGTAPSRTNGQAAPPRQP